MSFTKHKMSNLVAIIRVSKTGYRPSSVKVRSEIDAYLFTAELHQDSLAVLEADTKVESVSLSKALPLVAL